MDKVVSRKYFNDQAEHWDEKAGKSDPLKLYAMVDRLQIPQKSWVLDVGTGTGVFIPYIKEKTNHKSHIFSMDYAFNMLSIAKAKQKSNSIQFVCSEIENLHCSSSLFDVVVCYSTFPHFHDKSHALSNMHRLLKNGGWLYICHTASRKTINEIHRNIPDFRDHLLPERTEMESLLKQAGFDEFQIIEQPDSYLVSAQK